MERQLERCGGLDVYKETIAACVRVGGRTGKAEQHVQTFGATVGELLVLRDWLGAHGVTHVAMESTGVYWKPWPAGSAPPRLRDRATTGSSRLPRGGHSRP